MNGVILSAGVTRMLSAETSAQRQRFKADLHRRADRQTVELMTDAALQSILETIDHQWATFTAGLWSQFADELEPLLEAVAIEGAALADLLERVELPPNL